MNLSTLNIIQFLESSKIQIPNGFKSIKGVLDFDFYDLVKSIGESTSREEELFIVKNEIKKLKTTFSKDATKEKIRECLIRMVYCHMLGYEVPFGYIQALNMTQDQNILNKRTGYLALSLCLPEKHELLIMAVNSILKGLNSANYLEVCSALTAMTKLIDKDTIPAFMQKVLQLLNHPKSIVRKKSVTVLHRFYRLLGKSFLEEDQIHDKLRQSLCDRDPSVMAASICIFLDISNDNVQDGDVKNTNSNNKINSGSNSGQILLNDLVPSFVGILKQVAEGRLPNSFIYHGIHHPWLQINLLKLLANLGCKNKDASNHMYQVLLFTMQQAQKFKNNVGFAILYQTIKTLTTIEPNLQLIEQCSKNLSILLKSRHNNLKYFGIKALTSIVKVSPKLVLPYQVEVIESLESSDETLKRKSFDLLYRMTNQSNIIPVCSKLIEQLVLSNDQNFKSELIYQITNLAEKYSPNDLWYIDTISSILSIPNSISVSDDQQFAYNLIKLVSEEDDVKIKQHITEIYLNNLLSDQQQQQQKQHQHQQVSSFNQYSDIYIKIMSWVISEYSNLVVTNKSVIENTIIDYFCDLLEKDYLQGDTKSWIIMCIGKLVSQIGITKNNSCLPQLEILTKKFNTSKSLISQQRSFELQEILLNEDHQKSINQILPLDAYCEDIDFNEVFKNLTNYTNKSLEKGENSSKKYIPYEKRKNTPLVDIGDNSSNSNSGNQEKGLNFEYPPPPNPFSINQIQNQNRQIIYPSNQYQQPSQLHQQPQQLLLTNEQHQHQQHQHQQHQQQHQQHQYQQHQHQHQQQIDQNQLSLVPINQQLSQQIVPQPSQPQPSQPSQPLQPQPSQHLNEQTTTKLGLPKPNKVLWTKQGFVGNKSQPQNPVQPIQQQPSSNSINTSITNTIANNTATTKQQLENKPIDPEKEKLAQQLFGNLSDTDSLNNNNNNGIISKLQQHNNKKSSININNNNSSNNNGSNLLNELIDLSSNNTQNITSNNNNNNNNLLIDLEENLNEGAYSRNNNNNNSDSLNLEELNISTSNNTEN